MGGTGCPLGKTFFLPCQRRHPELPKIPTYLPISWLPLGFSSALSLCPLRRFPWPSSSGVLLCSFFFYVDQFEQSSGPGHHPMLSTFVGGITYKRGGKVAGHGSCMAVVLLLLGPFPRLGFTASLRPRPHLRFSASPRPLSLDGFSASPRPRHISAALLPGLLLCPVSVLPPGVVFCVASGPV